MAKFFDGGHDESEPDRGKPALAQQMGPLPLWGWAVVVVGGVFVWRLMMGGGKAAAAPPASTPAYPAAGGVGGVFMIPQQGPSLPATPQTGATTAASGGIPYAFVRGVDNVLWGRKLDAATQQWGPWTNFEGVLTSDPVISGNWVLARGIAHDLWGRQWNPTTQTMGPWTSFGGIIPDQPSGNSIVSGITPYAVTAAASVPAA